MAIFLSDLKAPISLTGLPTISGGAIDQAIGALDVQVDKGMSVITRDIAGVPQVPDAVTTTKWQRFIWLRITATDILAYLWNPNAASVVTYLQWQSISLSSLPAGYITTAMLSALCVTNEKIGSVDWTKLPAGGAATGDLTGVYPNPVIAPNAVTTVKITDSAVTTAKINANAVTHAKLGPLAVEPVTDIKPSGIALQQLRVNAALTAMEFYSPVDILQRSVTTLATYSSVGTTIPYDDTIPQIGEGTQIFTVAFTPKSATSFMAIRVIVNCRVTTTVGAIALFEDAGANALVAAVANITSNEQQVILVYNLASVDTAAHTFTVRAGINGGGGTIEINGGGGARKLGGALISTVEIIEYQP